MKELGLAATYIEEESQQSRAQVCSTHVRQ